MAAEKAAELTIVFRARNLMKDALAKAGKQINAGLAKVRQYQNEIRVLSKAALAVSVIGATLFVGSIVQAADFEKELSNVSAVTKANVVDQKKLRDAALEMGSKSVFAATQAAEAQLFLGQAGQSTAQIIASLPNVLNLAAASNADLGFAAEVTTATLSQFNLEAEDSARVANVFAASASNSLANLNKLSAGMRQAGPIAASLNQTLEGTSAFLNTLFDAGFKGEQGGTILRGFLASLAKPTSEAQELIAQLGLTVLDSAGKMLPMVDIVAQLEEQYLSAEQALTLFGTEAGPGLLAVIAKGSQALRDQEKAITGTDEAARQAAVRTDNLSGSITKMKSAIEGASISIGSEYIPAIRLATDLITGWVTAFNELNPEFKSLLADIALAVVVITGFAGVVGLIVVSVAVAAASMATLKLSFIALLGIVGQVGVVVALAIAAFNFVKEFSAMQNVAVAFFEFFERGWLGLTVVFSLVINSLVLGFRKVFTTLRETILKPLDLIFDAAKRLGTIDVNPFDSIDESLGKLQSHTQEVVDIQVKALNRVSAAYEEIHDAINKASQAQDKLKGGAGGTSDSTDDRVKKAIELAKVQEEAIKKAKVNAEALKAAFDLTGLVSTEDSVKELNALAQATSLLLESGELTKAQEKELIQVFEEKSDAIIGVTKRLEKMTEASREYNSALDSLLALRIDTIQGNLDKTLESIIDPKKIKANAKEAEKILREFSNRTDADSLGTFKGTKQTTILPADVLAEFRQRTADGEKVLLKFKNTTDGVSASVEKVTEGFSSFSTGITETETQLKKITSAVRESQDEIDRKFSVPLQAIAAQIEFLKETGASIEAITEKENLFKEVSINRIDEVLEAEKKGFAALKQAREANLKDIEANNKKIADLDKALADNAIKLDDIKQRREKAFLNQREAGLTPDQRRQNELKRIEFQLQTVPGLPAEKQVEALRQLAEKADAVNQKTKEGSVQFRQSLDQMQRIIETSDRIIESTKLISDNSDDGLAGNVKSIEASMTASGEAVDGFSQKVKNLQIDIASTNLELAVEMLDNATGPGKELKDNLLDLFGTPIIQEVIINQTTRSSGVSGGFQGVDPSFFDDGGFEFQASTTDLGGFGDNVGFAPKKDKNPSFATGIKFIPRDMTVDVHKGEGILTRSENDQFRNGNLGRRTIQFGDINITQPPGSNLTPREYAEQLMEEMEKIIDLSGG